MPEKYKQTESSKYDGFSLVNGGLIYSIISTLENKLPGKNSRRNRAIWMSVLTWVPLLLLVIIQGYKSPQPEIRRFITDLTMYSRFFVVVPVLILIESILDREFTAYIKATEHLIFPSQQVKFDRAFRRIDKLSNLYLPEILILGLIYVVVIIRWKVLHQYTSEVQYLLNPINDSLNAAGWYFFLFSLPVYQLLIFRWMWRIFIWIYSLYIFSRLELKIEAVHTDRMGGLMYLNLLPFYFSILIMAFATIFAAQIAMEIIWGGTGLNNYVIDIIAFVLGFILILYLPLIFFLPLLMKTKKRGIYRFGLLNTDHNFAYMDKWVYNPDPSEPILGSMDNSSLADITGSYAAVTEMKIMPIDVKFFALSLLLVLVPFFPLVFTLYSPSELLRDLLKSLFNS